MSESQNKRWRRSHSVLSIPSELSAPLRSATRARIINTGNTNNRVNMSFSFFLCAYSVLRLSLHTLPPGSAEESCSFLVDDRRIPEREREKNSSDLSRSYHGCEHMGSSWLRNRSRAGSRCASRHTQLYYRCDEEARGLFFLVRVFKGSCNARYSLP